VRRRGPLARGEARLAEVTFTMPDFVEQGDELGEIALLVIRARQRWRELKGLGA